MCILQQYPYDIPTEAFTFEIFKQAFVAVQSCVVHLQVFLCLAGNPCDIYELIHNALIACLYVSCVYMVGLLFGFNFVDLLHLIFCDLNVPRHHCL